MPVYSSQALYSLIIEQEIVQSGSAHDQPGRLIGRVHFDNTVINKLNDGGVIEVLIPGGKIVQGRVITSNTSSTSAHAVALSETQRKIISFDNNAGSAELVLFNDTVTEMVLHDVIDNKIYLADINANGDGQLRLQDNNDYYCVTYPQNHALTTISQQSPQPEALIPDVTTLRNLQSRPGSANVLYLDYWGGTLTDSAWNANYVSNAPINYTAFDTNGNPGSFSSTERYSMWLSWREVVEDFASFDINITTDPTVYAAAVTNRSRIIITTTKSCYPGNAGGLVYVGFFNGNSEYYKVGWTWNLGDTSMGVTTSHEIGHQLDLRHDGIGAQGYYYGHGLWGPIMGAAFDRPYAQWSKGEYPGANEFEDDVAIMTNQLGLITDEAGNGLASATSLNLPVNNRKGLISFGDMDS